VFQQAKRLHLNWTTMLRPVLPPTSGETATGSLPPEVGVVGGAQVYDRDGIRTGEAAPVVSARLEVITAFEILLDHAREKYPHFESLRGQRDINRAFEALKRIDHDTL